MIKEILKKEVDLAIKELYSDSNTDAVTVEVSDNFGDYACNASLVLANQVNKKPRDVAEEIVKKGIW